MSSYRRELDGLRALAVIAVIIYHANLEIFGFQIFQGGFFGVDVFFVLSGYLITGIIRSQMDNGTFTFRDFYWRRAKRIVPALVTMLLVTSGLAFLILLPSDLVTYAKSLQSTLYFGSNHFFYGEESYTAAASIYRPLLHTWSLSVEWQFYVVFPLIVWWINTFFPRYFFGVLLALALISLQASSFIVKVNPEMAFYLLPTRSWELILGGLVSFYNRSNLENAIKGSLLSFAFKSLPIIGLFLVVHSMIFVGHEVKHPSFITLLPVLGTCLFIMFAHKGELSNDLLSLKPFVGVGLISYSLYLWHQPVFVFFRFIKHDYFRIEQFILLVTISLLLSYFTYIFVEKKFRKTNVGWIHLTVMVFSVMFLFLYSFGMKHYIEEYFNKPMAIASMEATNKNPYECMVGQNVKLSELSYCYIGNKDNIKAIVVGDSHADALTTSISSVLNLEKEGLIALTRASCPFVINAKSNVDGDSCYKENFLRLKELKSNFLDVPIFIIARWSAYIYGQSNPKRIIGDNRASMYFGENDDMKELDLISSFRENLVLSACEVNKKSPVYITQPIPEMRKNIPKTMAENIRLGRKNIDYSLDEDMYYERNDKIREVISSLSTSCGVHVLDPTKYLCNEGKCIAEIDGRPIYYDGDHLSEFGNKLLSPLFEKALYH
ncbi:acyltransferase family protein [Vibrio splendidus]|uniref:acyltransferase family protein n=1 Tax=Vibrio splendidus TaxID=29497 RepID=UPI00076A725B|nr:acyltransferase family protein [Vibrio splendidus]PHX08309.1 O-acetyltransferase OatA [Vibrio splendidus]